MKRSPLDLSHFTHGSELERDKLARDLLEDLSQRGFTTLVNHGLSDLAVKRLFEQGTSFFRQQEADKVSIMHEPGPNPQRGWSRIGAENSSSLYRKGLLKSPAMADLKDAREHFDFGSKSDPQYANQWPNELVLPGFRSEMEEAFDILKGISATIVEALEMALKLPRGTMLDKITHEGNASEMRVNHYPAIDVREIRGGGVSRIWPHFDLGVITLLFQDGVGGLEFEDREKRETFERITCGSPSEMVVNVSETLQRWTNGFIAAGLHRVTIPQCLEDEESAILPERYSIAYFCKADRNASVGPIRQFVRKDAEPAYNDITAIEYHRQRLQSAY